MSNDYTEEEKQELLEQIGERIRDARERSGMTQEELAVLIGKTQKAISGYENGTRAIRITEIPDLARALGVHPGYFFGENKTSSRETLIQVYSQMIPAFQLLAVDLCRQLLLVQPHFTSIVQGLENFKPIKRSKDRDPIYSKGMAMLSHSVIVPKEDLARLLSINAQLELREIPMGTFQLATDAGDDQS